MSETVTVSVYMGKQVASSNLVSKQNDRIYMIKKLLMASKNLRQKGPFDYFLTGILSLLRPWDCPGKSTGVGCRFLLQEIFPTQGSNPGLLHCRQTLYHLSHQGRLRLKITYFILWIGGTMCQFISSLAFVIKKKEKQTRNG